MKSLVPYDEVVKATEQVADQQEQLADLSVQVQQIPAPTGAETARARWIEDFLRDAGLADVSRDEVHNVYGRIPGRSPQPAVLVTAHTDTVFPQETDLSIRVARDEERIYGPGLGDNSSGVAGLLALSRLLRDLPAPPTDIWLVANTGEEGLGDLRGMKAVCDRLQEQMGAAIVVEGMGLGRVVHRALGSRRFRVRVTAPGGHSWSDFGTASAVHVLTQLAADLTRLRLPTGPRTSFNIGRINGGTSVNTIAHEATLELDLRSEETASLQSIVEQALAIIARYQVETWRNKGVTVEVDTIGDRPSGEIAADHPLVQAAVKALYCVGLQGDPSLRISSTDANVPLSRGIPAVCVGVTTGGDAHRLEEWIDPRLLPKGVQHLLLLTWWTSAWLAGDL